jgi:hypothetical protein
MSEKFKISQFGKGKKLIFKNGKSEWVSNDFSGEIEFYTLTVDKIEEIQKVMKNNIVESDLIFNVIPSICNVELDIEKNLFEQWTIIPPRQEFVEFIDAIFEYMKDLIEGYKATIEKQKEMKNKMDNVIEKNPELKIEIEKKKIKTKEEILDELLKELINVKGDKEKRDNLLHKINKLQDEK